MKNEIGFTRKASRPKGKVPSISTLNFNINNPWSQVKGANLTFSHHLASIQLEEIYLNVSIIRAIIDGIARTISSLDWSITAKDDNKQPPEFHIKQTKEFFENININSQSFMDLVKQLVIDLLLFDSAAIEKVFNNNKQMLELYARKGSSIFPLIEEHGIIVGYQQQIQNPTPQIINFRPDEIVYLSLYATTGNPYGEPVLNSIKDEIATHIFASRFISSQFTRNEVPPGILVLDNPGGTVSRVQLEREKDKRRRAKESGDNEFELTILSGYENVQWIQLTRTARDMELIKLLQASNKQIFSTFGISPIDMGDEKDVNRASAIVQQNISKSKLIRPIVQVLQNYINSEIVWNQLYKDVKIVFGDTDELDPKLQLDMAATLVPLGILDVNEARHILGYPPMPKKEEPKKEENSAVNNDISIIEQQEDEMADQLREQELTKRLKEEFVIIEKNLIQNLSKEYFSKSNRTNNIIQLSGAGLFGKFKSVLQDMEIQKGSNILKHFVDSLEGKLRHGVRDFTRKLRTRKYKFDEKDIRRFEKFMKNITRGDYYNKLSYLSKLILRSK